MAERHLVKFSVPNRELGPTDIVFKAWDVEQDSFIGELRVSVGGVEWRGSRQRRAYTYRLVWEDLDTLLFKHASRTRRRPAAIKAPRRRARTASRTAPRKARRR